MRQLLLLTFLIFMCSCDTLTEIKQISPSYHGSWETVEISDNRGKSYYYVTDPKLRYDISNSTIILGSKGVLIVSAVYEAKVKNYIFEIILFYNDDEILAFNRIDTDRVMVIVYSDDKEEKSRFIMKRILNII